MRARQSKVQNDEVFGAIYVGNYITVVHFIVRSNKNQVVGGKNGHPERSYFGHRTCRLPGEPGFTMAAIHGTGRWSRDIKD